MALTGSAGAHFPNKKRMKKKRKPSDGADLGLLYSDVETFDSFLSGCSDWSTCSRFLAERDSREIANDNLALRSTEKAEKRRSGKNISFFDNMFHEIVNPEREGERQRSSISENSFSANSQKKKKKTAAGMGDDFSEVLGSSSTRSLSLRNKPTKSSLHSGSSYRALTNCISSVLGKDDLIQNLEITPVSYMCEIPEVDESKPIADRKSYKKDKSFIPPVSSKTFEEVNTQTWNPTTALMGEIDLHLELQNYLKEFENYSASKARTKNTLHNNKLRYSSSADIQTEKFFEGKEESTKPRKHSQEFLSKKYCHLNDESTDSLLCDDQDDEHVESRLHCSQTQLAKILSKIRKSESERPLTALSLEKTSFSKESIDGYEKILPFDSHAKKRSNNTFYQNFWGDAAYVYEPYFKTVEVKSKRSSVSSKKKSLRSEKSKAVFNLQDLILIYKSLLEEHIKLQRSSMKPGKNALFSHLNFLISKRLKEKRNEAILVRFSKKSFTSRHSLDGWKSLKKKDELIYLKDYVNAFQDILESSMPISEILHLNNIMSNLESVPDEHKKYLSPKNSETGRPKSKRKKEAPQLKFSSESKIPSSAESSPERLLNRSSSTSRSKRRSRTAPKEKKETPSSSKDLQLKLESFLNAVGEDYSGLSNLKGKMLVNVKVAKNQILVNDLSFLNNESSLPIKKTDIDGSSDLIIETMPKVQNKESRFKKNNELLNFRLSSLFDKTEEVKKEKAKSKKRKEATSEEKKNSECSSREPSKSLSARFEFDEMKFKAQHPIESIAEESEEFAFNNKQSKRTSEKKTMTPKYFSNIPDDPEFLKKLLVGDDDLEPKFDRSDTFENPLPRTKSNVIKPALNGQSFNLYANPPQIAKSLVDLKTRNKNSKKANNSSSFWPQKNFFCYSSITHHENPLASNKKRKQRKNFRAPSPKPNKMKKVETQKVFQEVSSKRMNSNTNVEASTSTSSLKATEVGTNTVKLQNSILYLSNEETDCCSIELLFTENNVSVDKPIATTEVKSQTKSVSEEQKAKTNVSNSVDFISSSSASVIFHPCNSTTDDRSYSLALIHSDSFLKCFSQASLVQRDIKTFFKSSSDVKFHPENENEGRKDVKPFITFVLTSEQFEKADFSDDVLVIKKTRILNNEKLEAEEKNPQIRLQSIENFIKDIAKAHAKKMSTKPKPEEKKDFTPSLNKRKSKTRCQTCQFLSKKEKEKRKGILKKMNAFGLRGTMKTDRARARTPVTNGLAKRQLKKSKTSKTESEGESEIETNEKTESKKDEVEIEVKKREREINKGSVMSLNLEDTPLELVEALKKAFSQVEDSKKKKGSVVEKKQRKRAKTPVKNASKKSFIIKIYCDKSSKKEIVNEVKEKSLPEEKKKETICLESPLLKKVEAENLESAESTYFDALEKNVKDDVGGAGEEMIVKEPKQSSINADPELNKKENEKLAVKNSNNPVITESEEELLQEQPEEILNEISKCIIEKQVSFLLLMLDSFLNKTENLLSKKGKLNELKNLIQLTNEKTKDLIECREKSSWLKVFMVLDDLSTMLADENVNNFIKTHLNSAKNFVQKILEFNLSKTGVSQKFDFFKTDDSQEFYVPIKQKSKNLEDKDEVKKISLEEEPREKITTVILPEIIQPLQEKTEVQDFFVPITQNLKHLENEVEVKEISFEEESEEKITNVILPEIVQPLDEEPKEKINTIILPEIVRPVDEEPKENIKTMVLPEILKPFDQEPKENIKTMILPEILKPFDQEPKEKIKTTILPEILKPFDQEPKEKIKTTILPEILKPFDQEPKEKIKTTILPEILKPFDQEPKRRITTVILPEIMQPFEDKTWEPLKTIIEEEEDLKKQKSSDSILAEIRDMKNKVVEELKLLEKMFLVSDWNQLLSSSENTKNHSKDEKMNDPKFSDEDGEPSKENNFNPNSRYLHFLQCLMKVWDTRMSLNIYPNDCFN